MHKVKKMEGCWCLTSWKTFVICYCFSILSLPAASFSFWCCWHSMSLCSETESAFLEIAHVSRFIFIPFKFLYLLQTSYFNRVLPGRAFYYSFYCSLNISIRPHSGLWIEGAKVVKSDSCRLRMRQNLLVAMTSIFYMLVFPIQQKIYKRSR